MSSVAEVNLVQAIKWLSAKAKQAMYAASQKTSFARSTWNGCAFNQAGHDVGLNIGSVETAAAAFGMSVTRVQQFITAWDSYGEPDRDVATAFLRNEIEKAGLFTDPPTSSDLLAPYKRVRKITTIVEFESTMEKFQAQLETDTVPGTCEALELLMGSLV